MSSMETLPVIIGGERRFAASGETIESINPATGEVIGSFPRCGPEDVAAAVDAARLALPAWRALHPEERARFLLAFADAIEADAGRLLRLEVQDNGSPISELEVDIPYGLYRLRYFAGLALEPRGSTIDTGWERLNYTLRQPYGVVARIIPFNHPLMFLLARMAAPLVAGNTLIVKPSEHTSLTAVGVTEHLARVFPPGVVNVVTGYGHEAGDAIVTHPEVRRLALIGSVDTGMRIAARAATVGIKHITHELGGKNPIVIWEDAPLEAAIDAVLRGMRFNFQGQSCGSTSRLFVHPDRYDELVGALGERLERLRIGDPLDVATEVGSLVNRGQLDKVLHYIDVGRRDGGQIVAGGERRTGGDLGRGLFVAPTLFRDLSPDAQMANEEIFGPVLAAMTYASYEDVVQRCNQVRYGLTATIYTGDLGLAHRFARDVEAGYVWVNDTQPHFHGTPFGGWKESGLGQEESMEELESYTQVKNVNVRFDPVVGQRAT